MWEQIKGPVIVIGVIVLVLGIALLWLLIMGADESRRRSYGMKDDKDKPSDKDK